MVKFLSKAICVQHSSGEMCLCFLPHAGVLHADSRLQAALSCPELFLVISLPLTLLHPLLHLLLIPFHLFFFSFLFPVFFSPSSPFSFFSSSSTSFSPYLYEYQINKTRNRRIICIRSSLLTMLHVHVGFCRYDVHVSYVCSCMCVPFTFHCQCSTEPEEEREQ